MKKYLRMEKIVVQKNSISIVIPAYNVENYIEQCLLSVIKQTYKTLEIIVVMCIRDRVDIV